MLHKKPTLRDNILANFTSVGRCGVETHLLKYGIAYLSKCFCPEKNSNKDLVCYW